MKKQSGAALTETALLSAILVGLLVSSIGAYSTNIELVFTSINESLYQNGLAPHDRPSFNDGQSGYHSYGDQQSVEPASL